MRFTSLSFLPENVRCLIQAGSYVGYVRIYYDKGRYGSRMFCKDAAKRYTEELKNALTTVIEVFCKEKNPDGKAQMLDFCKANGFDKTPAGYMGFACMAGSAFQIVVSELDGCFCRIYFYDRNEQQAEEQFAIWKTEHKTIKPARQEFMKNPCDVLDISECSDYPEELCGEDVYDCFYLLRNEETAVGFTCLKYQADREMLMEELHEYDRLREEYGKENYLRSASINSSTITLSELKDGTYILWESY